MIQPAHRTDAVQPEAPHVLHVFATFCAAGPQVRAVSLMNGLGAEFRHTVVACDGRTEAAGLVAEHVPFEVREIRRGDTPLAGTRIMRELLADVHPELLLTYNFGAMDAVLAARALKFRQHIHHEDGFNLDEASRLKARRNFLRRVALRRTDVIVPSRTLERIARRTWRLPRVHFVPNGVDLARFAPDPGAGLEFRDSLGIPREALVVGAVGHLRPVKNYPRLVRAVARIRPERLGGRPVHLVIAGEGGERRVIEVAAERSKPPGGAVHLTGHLTDVRSAYAAFDVLAISSDSEQQPVSLLEAMASGVPAVSTGVGDVRETLPPEARSGVVPMPKAARLPQRGATKAAGEAALESGLADALERLLADADLRARLAHLGRERVREEYSVEAMLEAHEALWRAALAG